MSERDGPHPETAGCGADEDQDAYAAGDATSVEDVRGAAGRLDMLIALRDRVAGHGHADKARKLDAIIEHQFLAFAALE